MANATKKSNESAKTGSKKTGKPAKKAKPAKTVAKKAKVAIKNVEFAIPFGLCVLVKGTTDLKGKTEATMRAERMVARILKDIPCDKESLVFEPPFINQDLSK